MSNEMAVKGGVQYIESWANFAESAGLIPQGTTTYQAMAIIQAGKEMGLQPLQSLRSMNFIKGRLVMSVQLQLALAKSTKNVIVENLEESDDFCKVVLKRGDEVIACEYTVEDAKKAGLIKPDGNWIKYQRQMLRWRAIGDALRIICPDLVMGLLSPEEAESIESFAPQVKTNKPAVTSPQTKTEPANTETQKTITIIKAITQKPGKNNSVRYKITGETADYFTFDAKYATLAKSAQDATLKVEIQYKVGNFGNDITGMDIVEPNLNVEAGDLNG